MGHRVAWLHMRPSTGKKGVRSMELIASFHNTARRIRRAISVPSPSALTFQAIRVEQADACANPSKMRLQVLRRDHFRCRGCGRQGDEITLEVMRILPEASTMEEMLTLCAHCRSLVERWNRTESNVLEILRRLWRQIGSATGTQSEFSSNTERSALGRSCP